jgi:two-component system, sensor histidine kinase and response regulator
VLPEETHACLAAGMDAYLAKPIDPAALARTLSGHAPRRAVAAPAPDGAGAGVVDEAYFAALAEAVGAVKFAEIVDGVADDVRPHRERFARACARGDLAEARAAVHVLRGIAANLGLAALAGLTAAVEDALAAGDGDRAQALAGQLDAGLTEALERLRAFRS